MVFSSADFLFMFFPLVLILYFLPGVKSRKYRNLVLLLASLGFYAWGEPLFVFLMIGSIIVNWYLGLLIGRNETQKKSLMSCCCLSLNMYLSCPVILPC